MAYIAFFDVQTNNGVQFRLRLLFADTVTTEEEATAEAYSFLNNLHDTLESHDNEFDLRLTTEDGYMQILQFGRFTGAAINIIFDTVVKVED